MISELDHGIRCDRHIGEAFPPRCSDCDVLTVQQASDQVSTRLGFIPGSSCSLHAGYPMPCASCARNDADENASPKNLTQSKTKESN
jgi:hypothetical protein